VDTSKMEITDSWYRVMNISYGYVSHSFNQFVVADNNHMVTVDHGDAYPRSAVLFKYRSPITTGVFMAGMSTGDYVDLMTYAGSIGANATNASIGGLEVSSTHYLVAGNSAAQETDSQRTRNIYVASSSRDNISNTAVHWLTSLEETGSYTLTTPKLVDLKNDTFMVLWADTGTNYSYVNPDTVYWTIVDHEGNPITETMTGNGILTNCDPVVYNNKVVWYMHSGNNVYFEEIDLSKNTLEMIQAKRTDWKEVVKITPNKTNLYLALNESFTLDAVIEPEDADDPALYFTSMDPSIATVSSYGYVTPEALGETVIRISTSNGVYADCKVTVVPAVTGMRYSTLYTVMETGETQTWNVTVSPEEAQPYLRFMTSDPSVLAISQDGVVTAVGTGTATVKAAVGQWGVTYTITVTEGEHIHNYVAQSWEWSPDYANANVTLVCTEDSMHTLTIPASVTSTRTEPTCTSEGKIVYTASAFAEGKTFTDTKTVTLPKTSHSYVLKEWNWSEDAKSASALFVCEYDSSHTQTVNATVTVNSNTATATVVFEGKTYTSTKKTGEPSPVSISLNKTSLEMATQTNTKLTAIIQPSDADQSAIWTSSDENIATVDSTGKVTALRYGKVTITAISKADSSLRASCTIQTRFYDVNDSAKYYYKPVYWAADNGITTGYDKVYFGPQQNCTRRELSIFLWRLAGKPAASGSLPFSDTGKYAKTTDSYKAILWCYTNGIVKGYSDGTFKPDNPIVRKDTMIMLYRLAKKPAVSGTLKFPDARALGYGPETDTYKSIVWGTQNGITNGYSDGSFKPLANCLREHIVTFVYRYDQKYN